MEGMLQSIGSYDFLAAIKLLRHPFFGEISIKANLRHADHVHGDDADEDNDDDDDNADEDDDSDNDDDDGGQKKANHA